MFGILEGGVLGLIFGCIYAGVFGVPLLITVAVLMWVFWLSRFRIAVAGFGGLVTGVIATFATFQSGLFNTSYSVSLVLAGLIGMMGGSLAGARYWSCGDRRDDLHSAGRWQFTLGDLFVRVTVVAVLLTIWVAIIDALRNV